MTSFVSSVSASKSTISTQISPSSFPFLLCSITASTASIFPPDELVCGVFACVLIVRKTSCPSSVPHCDDDVVVLSLPQHLPFEVHHLVFAAAQQDAHHLVRDLHVAIEESAEGYDGPPLLVLESHVSDDPHHLLHLPVDVFLRPVAPLRRPGPLFGPTVAGVALAEALGHGEIVVELLAEGVELLALHVLLRPLLPAVFDVARSGNLDLQIKDGGGLTSQFKEQLIILLRTNKQSTTDFVAFPNLHFVFLYFVFGPQLAGFRKSSVTSEEIPLVMSQ